MFYSANLKNLASELGVYFPGGEGRVPQVATQQKESVLSFNNRVVMLPQIRSKAFDKLVSELVAVENHRDPARAAILAARVFEERSQATSTWGSRVVGGRGQSKDQGYSK